MERKLNGKTSQAIVTKSEKSQIEMEDDIKYKITEFNKLFSSS